jgi:hypothetical protein
VHDDDGTHAAYRTAVRALCGRVVERGVSGGGQRREPSCEHCRRTLNRHRLEGLATTHSRMSDVA